MKEIRVIPRIGSLRIFAARDTVESSMPAQVRVEIRDRTGALIPGVAVLVRTSYTMQAMADSGAALLRGPGTHYVVAEFWDLRDSVLVTQLPPKGKRP